MPKDRKHSGNLYCCCVDYKDKNQPCHLCQAIRKGFDYRKPNQHAVDTYKVVVTGTNGKSSVTNILGRILSEYFGNSKVGYASSTGIYEGGERIFDFQHRASEHYVYLLNQPNTEIVISEQPEAGLYMYGLPINHEMGIITNITEDHLDRPWIRTGIMDVYEIKSLVAKMAVEGVVMSIDYPLNRKLLKDFPNKRYFLSTKNSALAKKYINRGYPVTYIEKQEIYISDGKKLIKTGKIVDYQLTLFGTLDYSILNLLTILTFLYHSEKTKDSFKTINEKLKALNPTFSTNQARFNLMHYEDKLIILDYAHNLDGYQKSMKSLRKIKRAFNVKKSVAVVGLLPDKTDTAVEAIAKSIAISADKVFVKSFKSQKNAKQLKDAIIQNGCNDCEVTRESYAELVASALDYKLIYISFAGSILEHYNPADLVEKLNLVDYGI
jgi:cyanophycin synthetase